MNLVVKKYKIKQQFKLYQLFIFLLLNLSIFACQNTQNLPNSIITVNTENFGQYYLKLKTLSAEELEKEIEQQQTNKQAGSIEAGVHLILLYSLPNSGIHNVYSAKSQLNEQLKNHHDYAIGSLHCMPMQFFPDFDHSINLHRVALWLCRVRSQQTDSLWQQVGDAAGCGF